MLARSAGILSGFCKKIAFEVSQRIKGPGARGRSARRPQLPLEPSLTVSPLVQNPMAVQSRPDWAILRRGHLNRYLPFSEITVSKLALGWQLASEPTQNVKSQPLEGSVNSFGTRTANVTLSFGCQCPRI